MAHHRAVLTHPVLLLDRRNHHVNRCASITEASNGFPGAAGRLPAECATIGQVLQDNGYSTFWVGKNHNVPEEDVSSGGSKSEWPLQKGFDRFYRFLGGETNQWYPDLVEDNRFIEQPYSPEDGYHLSKDLADQAIRMLRDQKATNPSKPWYLWFCPGANHAPHHVPQEYADKYRGQFDDGYEAYREWVLARIIEKGVLPAGTQMTLLNPLPKDVASEGDSVRPWDSLNADEKRLFARMAEVYAGFSEHADAQVGRIIDFLEQTGELDNTIIFYCADNGASGEGSPNGSVNENEFFNSYPDELSENMRYLETLGSPDTYNHYPTGWAVAFSTPFQMFKRYAQFAGGTCDPMVIHWPAGIKAKGQVRHQYHHATDIVPTILDVAGLQMPEDYRGIKQYPMNGVSMRYSFDGADAPTTKSASTTRCWEPAESGRTAGRRRHCTHHSVGKAISIRTSGSSTTSTRIAPSRRMSPIRIPTSSRRSSTRGRRKPITTTSCPWMTARRPSCSSSSGPNPSHRGTAIYYPDTSPVPEGVAANIRGRSYKIIANVDITKDAQGVIFAHGRASVGMPCSSRTASCTTSTTSSVSNRNRNSSRRHCRRASSRSGWSSPAKARVSTVNPSAPQRFMSTAKP